MDDQAQQALRRIDLYAASVCRDFGLEVPMEWRPTIAETVASVKLYMTKVGERIASMQPAIDRLGQSFAELMNRQTEPFGRSEGQDSTP